VVDLAWRPGKTGDFNRMGIVTMPAQDLKSCCFSAQPVVVSESRSIPSRPLMLLRVRPACFESRVYQDPAVATRIAAKHRHHNTHKTKKPRWIRAGPVQQEKQDAR
jgi:hypothetical protein